MCPVSDVDRPSHSLLNLTVMIDFLRLFEPLPCIIGHILHLVLALAAILVVSSLYARLTRNSITQVNGPPKTHWFFGNLTELHFEDVGDPQISWQKLYGSVFKIHGILGVHIRV
jgi:hypothetical protein